MRWRLSNWFTSDTPSHLFVGRLIVMTLGLFSAPIVARALGPEGRGYTAAISSVAYLLPIAMGGGIPVQARRAAAQGDEAEIVRAARRLSIWLIPLAAGCGALCSNYLLAGLPLNERMAAATYFALTPFAFMWMVQSNVVVGQGRSRAFVAIQVAQPGVYFILIVLGLVVGRLDVIWAVGSALAGMLACNVVASFLTGVSWAGPSVGVVELIGSSVKFYGSAVAEAISNRLDQAVAVPIIGAAQAGLYSCAVTVGSLPFVIGQALGANYFRVAARSSEAERTDLARQALRSSLGLGLVCSGLLAATTPWLVPIVFGSPFADAVIPAVIVSFSTALLIAVYVLSMVLAGYGRGIVMSVAQIAGLGAAMITLLWAGPTLGAVGAACATALGTLIVGCVLATAAGITFREPWRIRAADLRTGIEDLRNFR